MNDMNARDLTDEQLEVVTGGSVIPSITISTQNNVNTPINVNAPVATNTILFSKVSQSSVGTINTYQSKKSGQFNGFF